MTTKDFANEMVLAIEEFAPWTETALIHSIHTFDEVGLLTSNEGLVIRLEDDSEFQVTIVKSR